MNTFDEYELAFERTYLEGRATGHALGLAGEAGEAIELVKKAHFHGKPFDREAMVKELGDVLWYLAAMARDCGSSLSEVAERNAAKLAARYPNGFVDGGGIR